MKCWSDDGSTRCWHHLRGSVLTRFGLGGGSKVIRWRPLRDAFFSDLKMRKMRLDWEGGGLGELPLNVEF